MRLARVGFVLFLAAIATLLVSSSAELPELRLIGGPMIQPGDGDYKTSRVVCWRTAKTATASIEYELYYFDGKIHDLANDQPSRWHQMTLKNLEPYTRYRYRIFGNNRFLSEGNFETGKDVGQPFRFAVFGDSGSGRKEQYAVARQVFLWKPDLILHTGDLIYPKGEDKDYEAKFYKPYKDLISSVPFLPSPGNHDYGMGNCDAWLKNFALPGKERYYSFDYGNAHFIALDSIQMDEEQTRWLEEDLSKTDKFWKIVYFHYPPFSNNVKGSDNAAIQRVWIPLFAKYKVDIVFTGHDHLYTRFEPIDGVRYIIEGLGGKSKYDTQADYRVIKTDNSTFGFGLVQVYGRWLKFYHIANGAVFDTFEITK